MLTRLLSIPLLLITTLASQGHEFAGHSNKDNTPSKVIGAELYFGKYGYWHSGTAVEFSLNETTAIAFGAHVVQEETGAKEVPSYELELIHKLPNELEIEVFGFGYTEVEQKQAWGAGLRATKRFRLKKGISVAPFFGPAYAHVKASDETTAEITSVNHMMLLGGLTLEAGPVNVTLLGSHSFYDHDPSGLETPVDLESMTHFAAYENNDGFARDTIAVEFTWNATQWLTVNTRYAVMWFDTETRHAIAITPAVKLGEHVELTAGMQFLRGGEEENNLVFSGVSVSF